VLAGLVERFGWTFAPADKVMQIENDYDKKVYNGDIGYYRRCRSRGWRTRGDLRRAVGDLCFGELDTVVPAYAATIHKSQAPNIPP
jgi:exodeoxyribonuclease V alpha subunit